jgi:hypothetical protein
MKMEDTVKFSFPESWQNGEAYRLPAIEVAFSVHGLLLTWRINDNEIMSSADDDDARAASILSRLSAEGRAFSSWQEAAAYMQDHYPDYSARFVQAIEPLLLSERARFG